MRKSLLLLFLPFSVYSQDSIKLEEVIITDNRLETSLMETGRNVQVMTKDQIEKLPVQSVNELMQHIAGVDFKQRGSWGAQADVSLRGGNFDQCLVLVNGIKVNDPQTGHHTMNLGLDLNSIKQIEVIKGPAAARYGLNSFSGVINIITEPAAANEVHVTSSVGQAYDSQLPNSFYGGYNAQVSASVGTEKSRHLISGSRVQSTGYRPNTDFGQHALNYQSITKTKLGDFNVMGSFVQNDFGASGFYAFPIDSTSDEEVTTYLASAQHSIRKGAFTVKTKAYIRKNFDTYTLFREAPSIYQNRHRTDVGGGEIHASYTYRIGTAGVGVEYRQEAIRSNNLGQWVRDNYGVFAENRFRLLSEKLMLSTGIYINNSNTFGTQFLPSAELNYEVYEGLNAFASWGQSFRVPTFTDLYYVGPTNIGNPSLKPEESNNYEAGLKAKKGKHYVQLSGFYQEATNLIDWTRDSLSQPWQPQNYEAVTTTGVDFNYDLRADKDITAWLTWSMARLGYTWLNMQIDSSSEVISRYALNNLRHQLTMQTTFTVAERYSLSATARYLDREAYTSYWLVDLRAQYVIRDVKLWVDCTNLLDTDYIEAANAPMPGRWFRLGFDLRLR